MDKPKKKSPINFKAEHVEDYQISTELEEMECHACGGGGEVVQEWEGNEYRSRCDDCGGFGVFYIKLTNTQYPLTND